MAAGIHFPPTAKAFSSSRRTCASAPAQHLLAPSATIVAPSRTRSAILFLILQYSKNKQSASHLLLSALLFSLAAFSLLLPGLALRFPALSASLSSVGAPDAVITALFAASTPIVMLSRAKTILVSCLLVARCFVMSLAALLHPAILSRVDIPLQALLQPGAAANYGILTYFLQVRPPLPPPLRCRHLTYSLVLRQCGTHAHDVRPLSSTITTAFLL
jgi:hypothetical protein